MFFESRLSAGQAEKIVFSDNKDAIWGFDSQESDLKTIQEISQSSGHLFFMRNHSSAGTIWDYLFEKNNGRALRILHIDAHDDLKIENPICHDREELRRRSFQVGSFVAPRISSGEIQYYYWLKPKNTTTPADRVDIEHLVSQFGLQYLETPSIPRNLPFDVLDIDLDYFTAYLPDFLPDEVLKLRFKRLLSKILSNNFGFQVVTVASSPGFIKWKKEKPLLSIALTALRQVKLT